MEEKETVGINYEMEYFRLKGIERENKELKDTIINMTKTLFARNENLEKIIKDIDENLKLIARKR